MNYLCLCLELTLCQAVLILSLYKILIFWLLLFWFLYVCMNFDFLKHSR